TIRVRERRAAGDGCFSVGVVPQAERFTHISVEDDGTGIAAETMNHIFDPLFTTKQNGTGLGLAIAHQVITRHGGFIFAESELGSGTAFHIFLPAADVAVEARREIAGRRDVESRRVM